MKIFVVGLTLVLAFLVTGDSFADPGPCTTDFWGNCNDTPRYHHRRHHHHHYRHCSKDYWGRCEDGRPRWRPRHHPHYPVHHPRGEGDRGLVCHPRRRVVGDERSSREKAQQTAESAWRGAIRYDYGERYQNLDHGKDIRINCDPSTVPSRGIAKALKAVQYRCAIEATPCRAPVGATDERADRRLEVESDD